MQTQLCIDIQQLEIKQSVVNSLGMFLAIAEGFLIAKGIRLTPRFGYYDHFNVTKNNNLELIKLQLMNNYHIFIYQKENYLSIYKTYDFYPDNLPIEEIKKIVYEWIPYAEHIKEPEIYNSILLLFCEDESKLYHSYLEKIKNSNKTGDNTFTHPITQANSLAFIYQNKDEEMKNNEEKWKHQTKPTIDIILDEKPGTSNLSKKLNSINNLSEKEVIEKMEKDSDLEKKINDLLVQVSCLESSSRRDVKNKIREDIKSRTEDLKKEIHSYMKKYKDLNGVWTKIKVDQFEKQLKDSISNLNREEDKKMIKNISNIFFEEEDEK